jgi:hypothetical protein
VLFSTELDVFLLYVRCPRVAGRGGDDGEDDSQGDGGEEENVKCAACNRSTQPPDMQVSAAHSDPLGDPHSIAWHSQVVHCGYCGFPDCFITDPCVVVHLSLCNLQVFLFGSRYDARSVWNSTRWDQHMPPVSVLPSFRRRRPH